MQLTESQRRLTVGGGQVIMAVRLENSMEVHIRSEQAADAARITEVTELAFRHAAHTCGREHLLIENLRASGALSLSLVAESDLGIVGDVAASPVTVSASATPGRAGCQTGCR